MLKETSFRSAATQEFYELSFQVLNALDKDKLDETSILLVKNLFNGWRTKHDPVKTKQPDPGQKVREDRIKENQNILLFEIFFSDENLTLLSQQTALNPSDSKKLSPQDISLPQSVHTLFEQAKAGQPLDRLAKKAKSLSEPSFCGLFKPKASTRVTQEFCALFAEVLSPLYADGIDKATHKQVEERLSNWRKDCATKPEVPAGYLSRNATVGSLEEDARSSEDKPLPLMIKNLSHLKAAVYLARP